MPKFALAGVSLLLADVYQRFIVVARRYDIRSASHRLFRVEHLKPLCYWSR